MRSAIGWSWTVALGALTVWLVHGAAISRPFLLPAAECMPPADLSQSSPRSEELLGFETLRAVDLEPGSLVVIGSLDESGTSHLISVRFTNDDPVSRDSDRGDICRRRYSQCGRTTKQCGPQRTASSSTSSHDSGNSFERNGPLRTESATLSEPAATRAFRIPRFAEAQVSVTGRSASVIGWNESVAVYRDDAHAACEVSPEAVRELSDLVSNTALPHVTCWIGPVHDLDSNGRLNIVLTALDERTNVYDTPILGCVREADFEAMPPVDSLAGDVLFLNLNALTSSELPALLVHEIAHAAVYSRLLADCSKTGRPNRIPGWLNEIVAHLTEQQFGSPMSLAEREREFALSPGRCPIVADDRAMSLSTRRGGSRVAGISFLSPMVATPEHVDCILDERGDLTATVAALSGQRFDVAFREWSVAQALETTDRHLRLGRATFVRAGRSSGSAVDVAAQTIRLHGTAFDTLVVPDSATVLEVQSPRLSRLQITIIEPD